MQCDYIARAFAYLTMNNRNSWMYSKWIQLRASLIKTTNTFIPRVSDLTQCLTKYIYAYFDFVLFLDVWETQLADHHHIRRYFYQEKTVHEQEKNCFILIGEVLCIECVENWNVDHEKRNDWVESMNSLDLMRTIIWDRINSKFCSVSDFIYKLLVF